MTFAAGASRKSIKWSLIFSIIFMHFMIVSIFAFPLTFTPLALFYFFIIHFKFIFRITPLLIASLLLLWPFFVLASYQLQGGNAEFDRYFRTFFLWCFALFFVMTGSTSPIKKNIDFSREFIISISFIILISLAQVIFSRVYNSTFFYFPFGSHSYFGVTDPSNLIGDDFARAPAFYLEPSFCAFVLFFLITSILIKTINPVNIFYLVTGGIGGMIVIGSGTGILAMTGLACFILSCFSREKIVRVLIFTFLLLIATVIIAFFSQRFDEIGIEGSSGYWRLVAPLIIISKVLLEFPLGIPFGQIENYVTPLGLQHGQNVGASIDNGMFYLIFSFGWIAIPFLIWLCLKFIHTIYVGDKLAIAYWWFIIFSLQFSGGILLPEYIYPIFLLTYTYRTEKIG